MNDLEIQMTADGSYTLYSTKYQSAYHSMNGAITESEHVFIQNGIKQIAANKSDELYIFEMGFGTGLNAILSCRYAIENNLKIHYTAIDNYIPERNTTKHIAMDTTHQKILDAEWGLMTEINSHFKISKIFTDLYSFLDTNSGRFDVIYYDAFGPGSQPELWVDEIFEQLYSITKPGGIFTTYCSKGSMRRALNHAGFDAVKKEGPPGKRHMIMAVRP